MPKDPQDWDESDLQSLIASQTEESIQLDYKRSESLDKTDGKKNEMSKDVSSFANSGGGTIIYGIAENEGPPPNIPDHLDGVDPSIYSKEWLEQVLNSRVKPRIDGMLINPVNLTGESSGQVAYVVSIPQGSTAHQASDHKYYKRFNFESAPMEHYEILDVMNRTLQPKVTAAVSTKNRSPEQGYGNQNRVLATLSVRLLNIGQVVAEKVSIQFWIPDGYDIRGGIENIVQKDRRSFQRNGVMCKEFLYYHKQKLGLYPLFPGTDEDILDGNYAYIQLSLFANNEDNSRLQSLSWVVNADKSPPVEGSITMYDLFFSEN